MKKNSAIACLSIILAVLFLLAASGPAAANGHADRIDELVRAYHQDDRFNGTVLVAEGGEVIYKKGWGMANKEWNIPNGPETRFRIASMSKQFTAMLIMQLVEEGRIDLGDRLIDHIPEFRKETGERVAVHHLLTHTSGLPDYSDAPGFWNELMRHPMTPAFVIDSLSSGDLHFEPGTQYRYNNGGFYLLSLIVERITGHSFAQALQERIFDPLGMNDSGLDVPETILPNRADGYEQFVDGFENAPYRQIDNLLGTGAIYSTAEDLYRWDRALYTDRLLGPEYKAIMFTPCLEDYAYGMGVRRIPLGESGDSTFYMGHSGNVAGFNSRIVRLPEDGHCIILLCNIAGWTQLSAMYRGIINILYDLDYQLPRKSIAKALYRTIMEEDLEAALARYQRLRAEQPDDYDFDEDELNSLGYRLMRTGQVKQSIAIFRLNTEIYPDSWNVWDSLGEALFRDGRIDEARAAHRRSLELDPDQYRTDLAVLLERADKEPPEGDEGPAEQSPAEAPAADTPEKPADRDADRSDPFIRRQAGIQSLEIRVSSETPPKVQAMIEGYFSDGCTTLESITQKRTGDRFEIFIRTRRPAGVNCIQVIVPFREVIPLMVSGLKAGIYTVTVNDRLKETFTLKQGEQQ
jgi:CubicO group peptidase (beta-lactamase class C family)